MFTGCNPKPDCSKVMTDIETYYNSGNFAQAADMAEILGKNCRDESPLIRKADSLIEIARRIRLDFSVPGNQIMERLEKLTGKVSADDIAKWERTGWLECRMIDGEKRYFNRAASNLMLIRKFYEDKEGRYRETSKDPDMVLRLKHTSEILKSEGTDSKPVVPVNMLITFTITVQPDALPDGEVIRCWMPWPKECHPRQKAPELISASESNYVIAPDSTIHRSIYMEKKAEKGTSTVFQVQYRYQSAGQYFNITKTSILPYDKTSALYKKFTSEQLPQICFTDNVRRLADSITDPQDDPVSVVRKIYMWFKGNIPWSGALEYSTMANIPEYVLSNRRGDCGMQTLLFMSMLRYKGIPVRWQSGWMVPPGSENLHDWCEIYFEGIGWVPSDVSYNLQDSDIAELREFYLSGIDSYRLIANDGISGKFYPEKKFMRSDPYDFQRGEIEWKGGNLYYDKWDYEMKIEYLK
jgi:Transglutaminase-like superfamily